MFALYGVPDRTRTCDPQFRKLLLYPTELRGQPQTAYCYGGPFASSVRSLWPELRWAGNPHSQTASPTVAASMSLRIAPPWTWRRNASIIESDHSAALWSRSPA